jgi:hypothetical protein
MRVQEAIRKDETHARGEEDTIVQQLKKLLESNKQSHLEPAVYDIMDTTSPYIALTALSFLEINTHASPSQLEKNITSWVEHILSATRRSSATLFATRIHQSLQAGTPSYIRLHGWFGTLFASILPERASEYATFLLVKMAWKEWMKAIDQGEQQAQHQVQ